MNRRRRLDSNSDLWTDAFDWLLLAIYSYCSIRANQSTVHTSCAIVLNQNRIAVSLQVDLVRETKTILRTSGNAQLTPLTDLFGYCHCASYHKQMPLSLMAENSLENRDSLKNSVNSGDNLRANRLGLAHLISGTIAPSLTYRLSKMRTWLWVFLDSANRC